MSRRSAHAIIVGLGVLAGAVLQQDASAQDTTRTVPRRDTIARIPIPPQPDTIVRRDSAARGTDTTKVRARADSMQARFARAELPQLVDAGRAPLVWPRDSILATGAITLADLLDRVPALTTLRTAWLGLPAAGAYLGDVSRVRIFVDGLELDPAEPRGGDVMDVTRLPIWLLDELRIEQTAGEVRVHARTWEVDRTTPYSRVDVATGDQDTDVFRFFFGRRFGNGLGLQAAVDQYSTTPDRGATNSQTSLFGRVGWAKRDWQADAVVLRQTPHRGVLLDADGAAGLPALDLTRTEAYVRGGYGSIDGPLWVQVLAGAHGHRYTGVRDPQADSILIEVDPVTGDTIRTVITADTSRFVAQYAITAGGAWGPLRASATHRMRVLNGDTYQTPSGRLGVRLGFLDASATAEARGIDSVARVDGGLRLMPLRFIRLGGSVAFRDDGRTGGEAGVDWRGEGALRLLGIWFGGGVMSRAQTRLPAATLFDEGYVATVGPAAQGAFATVQGRIWGPLQADLQGEAWQDEGLAYRPRYQSRADVFLRSNFLERFPSGNFGLYALLRHEYRSAAYFPTVDGGFERTVGHRMLSGLLEIRILDATLTYQFRNMLATRFRSVPDFDMPRQTQFYGVRWTFWN
jgi:hypothetical protein